MEGIKSSKNIGDAHLDTHRQDMQRQISPTIIRRDATGNLRRLSLDQWQSFVDSRCDSMIFHHRRWIELITDQYGFEVFIYGVQQDGQIQAAIPFLETTNLTGSKKLIALPFSDYMQVIDSGQKHTARLCQLLRAKLGQQYKSVVIRSDAPIAGVESFSPQVRHELFTARTIEAIHDSFDAAVKRNLRRTCESQLRFERRSDLEAIDTFYALHVRTRRKLGIPVQPRSFFKRCHDRLLRDDLGFVGIVRKDQTAIAAGVFFTYNSRLVYKYAASHPAALGLRPNDHLVYSAIKIAVDQGCRWFDFGISARQHHGLRRFKRKWGATEYDVHYNYVTGTAETSLRPSAAQRLASIVIRHGPLSVCRGLGEVFYKYSQ